MDALRFPAPTRRAAMLGGSAAVLATITGCTTVGQAQAPPPGPEVSVLTAAIQNEAALIALYEAVLRTHRSLADRLKPLHDHHTQHLAVLQRHYVPGTNTGTATPAPRPAVTAPGSESRALAALRSAERKAASARAEDAVRADPGLAQLLACIGACEAGHAQSLAGGA
ncbi:hypothetical protein [Actinoallomurus soli]|uniref:hypothetical protein n=1 Tax=Actinoallomurus soli TaxID=2952535 RepID=UPI002092D3CB|nr:hypothetical protein [Actinoallomurus soli]MCO5974505.1 hypothetical protein [Actinoallomurus soli]